MGGPKSPPRLVVRTILASALTELTSPPAAAAGCAGRTLVNSGVRVHDGFNASPTPGRRRMPVFVRVTTADDSLVLNANHIVEIYEQGDGAAIALDKGVEVATYAVLESVDELLQQLSSDPRNRWLAAESSGAGG
jgi:hypothetical protein